MKVVLTEASPGQPSDLRLVVEVPGNLRLAELKAPLAEDAALLTVDPVLTGNGEHCATSQRTGLDAVLAEQERIGRTDARINHNVNRVALSKQHLVDHV